MHEENAINILISVFYDIRLCDFIMKFNYFINVNSIYKNNL